MAIGAYAAGIAAIPISDKELFLSDLPGVLADIELSIVPALLVGGIAAALLALVTGIGLMRLNGAAASIATLGLLVITVNVLSQATSITHGPAVAVRRPGRHDVLLGLQLPGGRRP